MFVIMILTCLIISRSEGKQIADTVVYETFNRRALSVLYNIGMKIMFLLRFTMLVSGW